MEPKFLKYERQGFVGILTINRPEALNALNSAVVAEATAYLAELAKTDVRALVVTGAGEKSFVAGADIAEMKDLGVEAGTKFSEEGNALMESFENFPVPVIAAINGFALGGGCEIALSCDIRLASVKAKFGFPEVGLGILPGYGGIQRATRLLGAGVAKELGFSARIIGAEEALAIGLVNHVYEPEQLLPEALKLAETIATKAPFGVRAVKAVANNVIGLPLNKSTRLEAAVFGACFATADQKAGMAYFLDKNKDKVPVAFTGK
jgi:enoyl-CoA hydratase